MSGWIGVDLDGTLAKYEEWKGEDCIGEPVPLMVERVQQWLALGKEVRIFTARMCAHGSPLIVDGETIILDMKTPIEEWCLEHIGRKLPVTNAKDFGMIELWDDRCVQVIPNTGVAVGREA